MRWRFLLAATLMLSACDGEATGPPRSCYDTTTFSLNHSTENTREGRSDRYEVSAVLLTAFDPCYGIDGGDVYLNGRMLLKRSSRFGVRYSDSGSTPMAELPIGFGGERQRFTVTGGELFPAIADSIHTHAGAMELFAPTPFDTLSKERDLVIEWSPSPREHDTVEIIISEPFNPGPIWTIRHYVPDNGRHVVVAPTLIRFTTSPLDISVSRSGYQRGRLADGRPYRVGFYTISSTRVEVR